MIQDIAPMKFHNEYQQRECRDKDIVFLFSENKLLVKKDSKISFFYIKEFTKEKAGVNLAISLHAPTDLVRDKIMPINKAYKIGDIMDAVRDYIAKTNRRVTFEYILLQA